MASTRQPPPVHIFQDPIAPPPPTSSSKPRPQLQPSAMPLQPIKNTSTKHNINIQPPRIMHPRRSPSKAYQNPSPPLNRQADFSHVSIPPPAPPGFTDSLLKDPPAMSLHPRPYVPPNSQRPLFTMFPSVPSEPNDKENYHAVPALNDNFADFPNPSRGRDKNLKRSISEITPFDRPYKRSRGEEELDYLPEPEDMPTVEDEGTKPSHSYASLIGMAILRAPQRRLTLAQIYKWISDTYAFYRGTETGWQNSIRHNLSLNKAFQKQERPKGDSGKGNYWTIAPGMEMQFIKEKPTRKGTAVAHLSINPQAVRHHAPAALVDALAPQNWLPPPPTTSRPPTASSQSARPATAPELPELSSDATLPASDPALQDDFVFQMPQSTGQVLPQPQSSPPIAINSSPPMLAPSRRQPQIFSPTHLLPPSGRLQKRKAPMDDSGYFSSLESSALRNHKSTVMTSDLDLHPRKKRRGRAEEEIARIRGSSHDITPSRLRVRRLGSGDLRLSSPLREIDQNLSNEFPTTPASAVAPLPPPSVSPNTYLRFHRKNVRDLVRSPERTPNAGILPWSPMFKIGGEYVELPPDFYDSPDTPQWFRETETYAEITGKVFIPKIIPLTPLMEIKNAFPSKTGSAASKRKRPAQQPMSSPSKPVQTMSQPEQENFFDWGEYDEDENDYGGVDICQGFQKIGDMAAKQNPSPTKSKTPRPALARSSTSRF